MKTTPVNIPLERIEKSIYFIRGEKVILDRDLAELYEVKTKALNQAVRRNRDRFPSDFMFQLNADEVTQMKRSQFVTGSLKQRDPRFRPYAFTEQGVAMLSSLFNVEIMRTFVRLRQMLVSNAELARKLAELERKYDKHFKIVFDAIRQLMRPSPTNKKLIGFRPKTLKK